MMPNVIRNMCYRHEELETSKSGRDCPFDAALLTENMDMPGHSPFGE
ncbi:hypothetical protein DAI22_04g093250 [Oryza sativa Japonica Group]|nr:hypothetical protein DAI22_04g093250 [Oryza sativa Japonica Group]